jgi:hypothetical protein
MIKYIFNFVVLIAVISFFSSCDENFPAENNPDYFINYVTIAIGPTLGDQVVNAADMCIDSYYTDSTSVKPVDGISQVLKTGIQQVVDFGRNGYVDISGRAITGSIHVSKIDNQSWSYLFKELTINGNSVFSVRNVLKITDVNFEINSKDTVIFRNGLTAFRNWSRNIVRNCSSLTCEPNCKNCYSFTGNVDCQVLRGENFSINILQPLVVKEGYKYFIQGKIETITPRGTQILDFGNGEVDNLVTSEINGKSEIIRLSW